MHLRVHTLVAGQRLGVTTHILAMISFLLFVGPHFRNLSQQLIPYCSCCLAILIVLSSLHKEYFIYLSYSCAQHTVNYEIIQLSMDGIFRYHLKHFLRFLKLMSKLLRHIIKLDEVGLKSSFCSNL